MVLLRLARGIDALSEWTGRAISWLTLAMVLVTFTIVVLRYLFNLGWIAMQESVIYLHALVFMLGSAYTLKHDGHVRVDIFYRKLGPRAQAIIELLGTLLLLLPVTVLVALESWDYVASSWALRESSPEAGGLPGVYLLKTSILLMAGALLLQGLARGARGLLVLMGHREAAEQIVHEVEV